MTEGKRITPEHRIAGQRLFRFWDAEGQYFKTNLERLISYNELYMSARNDFNDPFDVRPILKCDWTAEAIRQHAQAIFDNPSKAQQPRNVLQIWRSGVVRPTFSLTEIRKLKKQFPIRMSGLLDRIGICSFTEEMQNPILWAHYANCYTGVCVELSATADRDHPFSNVMKVH
jgi:hypothetical protein